MYEKRKLTRQAFGGRQLGNSEIRKIQKFRNSEIPKKTYKFLEKKIIPDFFTPKSNRSRLFFSFCKRVDRMVS